MKTRIIIVLLVVCAVVTLSFTVVSVKNDKSQAQSSEQNEPIGGFVAEDKL